MKGHIRARGVGRWELKFDAPRGADGERRVRTETVRGSKSAAQRRLRELLGAIDRHEHVDRSRTTIAELVAERIALWRAGGRISAKTCERREELARNQIGRIGTIQLQRLSTADIEAWHVGMLADGLAPRTVRNAHSLLAQCLDDAVKHGLVLRNVARLQKPPRVARTEVEIIPAEAIEATLAKLQQNLLTKSGKAAEICSPAIRSGKVAGSDNAMYAAVVVALYSGARRGEQLALTWADVDLDARTLRIERALEETRAGIKVVPTKTRRSRTITLPMIAVDALRDQRRKQLELRLMLAAGRLPDDALIFPGHDFGHQSPRNFSTNWSRLVQRLGMPRVTWHSWRHTHASMLIAAGIDIATIAKRLGHTSPATTLSTYAHCFRTGDQAVADAIDALGR